MADVMTLTNIPLSVLNRALDLYNVPRESSSAEAWMALLSAEQREDQPGPLTPFAQAFAECISLTGPWSEDGGEYEGAGGYRIVE